MTATATATGIASVLLAILSFYLDPSCISCFALSSSSAPLPSLSPSSRYLSWYDDTSRQNGQLDLTHRAFIDPLPELGDGLATFDDNGNVSGERSQRACVTDTVPNRLVRYASLAFPHHLPTKSRAAKCLKSGKLLLNATPKVEGCRNLQRGDVLTLQTDALIKPGEEELVKRVNFVRHLLSAGLSVQYEDEHLAVVYKPAGVHTKRDTTFRYLSFEDALPAVLTPPTTDEAKMEALPLPLAVHRLDVRVCGLVLVAKTRRAMVDLGAQFERRTVKKRYEALVIGDPAVAVAAAADAPIENVSFQQDGNDFVIDSSILVEGRGTLPARTGVTIVSSLPHAHWGTLSHLELRPETGRTHQLRVHCADIGCPIIGDDLYWDKAVEARRRIDTKQDLPPVRRGGGLYLQSMGASFVHPVSGNKMDIDVPVANKFGRLLDKARIANEYDRS